MAVRRWRVLPGLLAVGLLVFGCSSDTTSPVPPDPAPTRAGAPLDIGLPRAVHRATPLPDGSILLTGGCSAAGCEGVDDAATSEVVAPDGTTAAGPAMSTGRVSHTATLLPDGRVLVAGGYPGEGQAPTASMELYDPDTDEFADAGELQLGRADHTATLLPDGRVLVAGGRGSDGDALDSVELVDPAAGTVTAAPPLPGPRTAHTATPLDGCVLLVGGTGSTDAALRSTVVWCAAAGSTRPGPSLLRARVKQAAAPLPGGGLWVLGGAPSTESRQRFRDTELLLPGARRFVPGPDLPSGRYKIADAVATLADGRVVVAGGRRLVVFDLATRRLQVVEGDAADLGTTRSFQTASTLPGDRVLVAGGYDREIAPTALAWLVDVP